MMHMHDTCNHHLVVSWARNETQKSTGAVNRGTMEVGMWMLEAKSMWSTCCGIAYLIRHAGDMLMGNICFRFLIQHWLKDLKDRVRKPTEPVNVLSIMENNRKILRIGWIPRDTIVPAQPGPPGSPMVSVSVPKNTWHLLGGNMEMWVLVKQMRAIFYFTAGETSDGLVD